MNARLIRLVTVGALVCACATYGPESPARYPTQGPAATQTALTSPAATLEEASARAAHTATTLADGSVFVVGGCVTDGCSQASAETFRLLADGTTVISGPSLAGPRDGQTATRIGDDVILVGGYSGEGRDPLATIEVFHAATEELEVAATMGLGRGGHAAAALGDGTVLIVAGSVRSRTPSASAVIFDPATNTLAEASDLPIATDGLDAVALSDGRVLVTGGLVDSGLGTDQAFIFDPSTSAWTSVGPMLKARFKHFSVLLDDGRVLVTGGTTDDRTLLAATEIFDPATSTFSAGPDLHEPRYKMTGGAVVMDADRVLIAGGGRSVEIVNVESNNTTIVDTFSGRGSFATLNAWGAGSFIVLGGYDDQIRLRREFLLIPPDALAAGSS